MKEDLNEKLLDNPTPRYDLVRLSSMHFHALKSKYEFNGLTVPELIIKSLSDILDGKITPTDILEAHTKKQAGISSGSRDGLESANKKSTSDEKQTTTKEAKKK